MGARNDAELRALLEPALQKAVDYTADKILEENYDIIQEVVYNAGSPNVYGELILLEKPGKRHQGVVEEFHQSLNGLLKN